MREEPALQHAESIAAVSRAFSAFGNDWVVIGGVALALVAVPRYTADLDTLTILDTAEAARLMTCLAAEGFEPLFSDALDQVKRTRILPVKHPGIEAKVDIALGCMPFEEEVVERATEQFERGIRFRVATPEDLIIMKAIPHRPQDRADIQSIAQMNPDLDLKRIERWVRDYAELLEAPERWAEIQPLLKVD